jgi:hypothetical protein
MTEKSHEMYEHREFTESAERGLQALTTMIRYRQLPDELRDTLRRARALAEDVTVKVPSPEETRR